MVKLLAVAALLTCCRITAAAGNPKKGCAGKAQIEKSFKACMAAGGDKDACKTTLATAMQETCGAAPGKVEQKKLVNDEARKTLAACKMSQGTDCDKTYRTMVGAPEPTDAKKAELKGNIEAANGAREALAAEMSACTKTKDECKAEMQTKLGNLKGRTFSKAELAGEMQEAGRSAAGTVIKDCIAAAADAAAKSKCMKSDDAKAEYAKASGRKPANIADSDLRAASRESAQKDLKETVNACVEEAGADAAAKKACFQNEGLKSKIADSMNMDATKIKDSKVRAYVQKSAQKDVLTVMQNCDKTTEAAKCKELMKDLKAQASGKDAKDISDDDLKKDANAAMKADLAEKMTACVEEAEQEADEAAKLKKMGECRTILAKDAIKRADFDGKEPARGKVQGMLKGAAASKAKDVMKDCEGTREECMALMKDRVGKAMGKSKEDISTKDAELFNKKGAVDAVKEGAKACMDAKKDDPTASCDDLYTQYLESRKKSKPTSSAGEKTDKARVMQRAAGAQVKADLDVCYEKTTKADVDACMEGLKGKRDAMAKELFGATDDKSKKLLAQKKRSEDSAKNDYLGERLVNCMEEAADAAAKKQCMTDMDSKRKLAGIQESTQSVMKKFQAKQMSEAATECTAADRKACVASAKASFAKSGLKEREYKNVKKLGEVMAAAEVLAACKLEEETDDACLKLAKEKFLAVTGVVDADGTIWATATAKVKKLAAGITDGKDIIVKLKEQIAIAAETDGSACDPATNTKVADKVKKIITDVASLQTLSVAAVKVAGCLLVDAKAEYSVSVGATGLSTEQIEAASDSLSTGLQDAKIDRRLGEALRRLVSVSGAFAAQESEMCASDDNTCGKADDATGSSTSSAFKCMIGPVMLLVFFGLAN